MLIHVEFKGRTFWVEPNAFKENHESPIIPEDHVENGELREMYPIPMSYAHLFEDGRILRFLQVIGHRQDLKKID